MAGRVCVREECASSAQLSPRLPTSNKEAEHKHEGARPEELVGELRVKKYGGVPAVGLVPARFWVGSRQFLGWLPAILVMVPANFSLAALHGAPIRLSSSGAGMLHCSAATTGVPQ